MLNEDSFAEATLGFDAASSGGAEAARVALQLFTTPSLVVKSIGDIRGVEAAGALKNIVALGVGFAEGCGHGANARAAIIRLGILEMAKFAVAYLEAGSADTFTTEACGLGDLILTCTAGRGRNLAAKFVEGDSHTRVSDAAGRWDELETAMFNGMKLPDWHSVAAMKQFLSVRAIEDEFPLFAAIGRIAYDCKPALHIIEVCRASIRNS